MIKGKKYFLTFYNPADYRVNAKMVFPFGIFPYYAHDSYDSSADLVDGERAKCSARVDGNALEIGIRHTYCPSTYYYGFDIERDMAKLKDGYAQDDVFKPTSPVTKRTYRIDGLRDDCNFPYAVLSVGLDGSVNRAYLEAVKDCKLYAEQVTDVKNGSVLALYSVGELSDEDINWKLFEKIGNLASGRELLFGSVTLVSTEPQFSTLEQLLLRNYDENGAVSKTDWYNAAAPSSNVSSGTRISVGRIPNYNPDTNFMRWLTYDVSVGAGESIVNEVTVPMYPAMDVSCDYPQYTYDYLLSPAKTWSSFGTLQIVVNTSSYMLSANESFERTETGYQAFYDGLPDGELSFVLCKSADPQPRRYYGLDMSKSEMLRLYLYCACATFGIGVAVFLTVFFANKLKRRAR